jgi:hypothetical protein
VLDERLRFVEPSPDPLCRFDPIDTFYEFAKFRLTHTDGGFPPMAHFGICAFEIHGDVKVVDECPMPQINLENESEEGFDPWRIREQE